MVDSADEERIKECNDALKELLSEEKLAKLPLLVFANKQDLDLALEAGEVLESLQLAEIQDRAWQI